MLARDFCYWLQGSFELGRTMSFGTDQIRIIVAHLELVKISDRKESKAKSFCDWLSEVLEWRNEHSPLPEKNIRAVAKKLSDVFIHEIDPSFPENQQNQLSAIHDKVLDVNVMKEVFGEDWRPGMRC